MPRKVRKGHRGGAKLRLRKLVRSLYEVPEPGNLLGIDSPHESWMIPSVPQPTPARPEEPIVARDPPWVLHKIDFTRKIERPPLLHTLAPGDPRVHVIRTPPRPTGPFITSIVNLETKPVTVTNRAYSRFLIKINQETRPLMRLRPSCQK